MKYCMDYAALLDLYVDGELPVEEMARVQAHLETCPGCRAYVDDALAIRAAFPSVEETEVPEGFAESVMARIRLEGKGKTEKRKPGNRRWLGVFASLAACCALVVLLHNGPATSGGGADMSGASGGDAGVMAGSAENGTDADFPAPAEDDSQMEGVMEEEAEGDVYANTENTQGAGVSMARSTEEAADVQNDTTVAPAAPALMAPQEPEAPEEQEPAEYGYAEAKEAALTLEGEEVREFLDDWTLVEEADNVRWYTLTAEQYQTLRAALPSYEADSKTEMAEESVLVKVTGPF